MIGLKYPLGRLGISKLEQGPATLVFTFTEYSPVDPEVLLALIDRYTLQKKKNRKKPTPAPIRLTPDHRLIVPLDDKENIFTQIDTVLQSLATD